MAASSDLPAYTNPLVLYGSVVVNPNSDGVIPNASLANPFGMPMEILEIRFRILPQPGENEAAAPVVTGLGLAVKMDIGKVAVVDAYVPVGDLGTSRDSYDNQPAVYATPDAPTLVTPTTYGWRLKYPLFVPAETVLSCVVRSLGQNHYPVQVDVAYIGRTWDVRRPLPTKAKVPWVTSYESKSFEYVTGAPASQDVSSDLDIVNPFGTQLEVARFGGRCAVLYNEANQNVATAATDVLLEDPTLYRDTLGTVRIRSSRGFDIVRTPTAFGGLFPFNWRAWDMAEKWFMAPREAYKVRLTSAANPDTVNTEFSTSENQGQVQYSIGLTGYRDVPVSAMVG